MKRKGTAEWSGDLKDGNGAVSTDSGIAQYSIFISY